jgi:hypothetical protein
MVACLRCGSILVALLADRTGAQLFQHKIGRFIGHALP